MGLFGNIIKPLKGELTHKQKENMIRVAQVFKEETGKDYKTTVIWKVVTKKKITKTIHTYYNWIMGYGIDENEVAEIILIPVDPKWDWIGEPMYFKSADSKLIQDKKTMIYTLQSEYLEDGQLELNMIISMAMMSNYVMDVNYMNDYTEFDEYCKKYWM